MVRFPQPPADDYSIVYLTDTDRPLPETINPNTRYAYFKTIARGGRSIIESCKDLHLMRVVARKSLKPEFAENPVHQTRLIREARVAAMLQHPNTVPTYELGRDNRGHCYFTMKLVHGYTFREVLDYRERYDLPRLIHVVIQIAHALEYAHGHGVAHRDIKPENILVGPFGEVLLLDWGLAKVWNPEGSASGDEVVEVGELVLEDLSITAEDKLQGTAAYMSPEQIRETPDIDWRTDIYSLGAVLYEILAGRPPAVGETLDELLSQTLDKEPPKPSELAAWPVAPRLEELCMGCLVKEPDARFGTAGELIRELEEDWQ